MRKPSASPEVLTGYSFGNEQRPRCPEATEWLRSDVSRWIKQRASRDSSPGLFSLLSEAEVYWHREELLFPETQRASHYIEARGERSKVKKITLRGKTLCYFKTPYSLISQQTCSRARALSRAVCIPDLVCRPQRLPESHLGSHYAQGGFTGFECRPLSYTSRSLFKPLGLCQLGEKSWQTSLSGFLSV